jgi:hypothetical protein
MHPGAESHRLEHWVHRSLLAGLIVSGLLMAAGLTLTLSRNEPRPEGKPPSLVSLVHDAAREDGVGLMQLGLLVLMVTPVLRVLVLAVGWSLERRWTFMAVAMTVMTLLAVSLVLGVR